jgi:uncharacterized protein YkwD
MRLRLPIALVTALVALFSTLFAPSSQTSAEAATIRISMTNESTMVRLTNNARAQRNLKPLRVNAELVKVARSHALRMARENKLYHNPRLPYTVTSYRYLGENVGYSPSVTAVQRAFMKSPTHRANILASRFTQVGIGVAVVGDRIWVTEVFRRPKA